MRTLLLLLGFTAVVAAARTTCPEGWVSSVDADASRCYRFVEERLNWEDALTVCRGAGGELLSLRSTNEKDWILNKLNDYSTRTTPAKPIWQWWIGLNLPDNSDHWQWSDGTPAEDSIINWQPNQPDRASAAEKCGELHPSGINDNNCNTPFAYICARDKSAPSSPCQFGEVEHGGECIQPNPKVATVRPPGATVSPGAEPVQGSCPTNWVESPVVEDRCYRFEAERQTWHDANSICEFAHGHLVSIRTMEEMEWIRGQVQRVGHEHSGWFGFYHEPARPSWWTGLNKLNSNRSPYRYKGTVGLSGGWTWADGQPVDNSLLVWQVGEPNEYGNEDCGELSLGGFNDNMCETKFPYICARSKSYVPDLDECAFGEHRSGGSCIKYEAPQSTPSPTPEAHIPVQGDCLDGWESSPVSPNRCYRFEKDMKLSWHKAQVLCQTKRGELVSFGDVRERDWVKSVVSKISYPHSWWTGLNRLGSAAVWRWSDASLFDEANIIWQPSEPNNVMERCGEMYSNGLNDNGCWKKFNFICARDKDLVRDAIECPFGQVLMGRSCEVLQIATPAPPPAGACTDGWIEGAATQGKCYRFVTDSLSASDAKKMCRAANGDLLVIKSEAEQLWVQVQVERESQANDNWEFYIGLKKTSDKWEWADGTLVSDINTVLKGPNAHGDCTTILPEGIQRDQCWSSKSYICSRPAVLDPEVHVCPWGETWKEDRCQLYEIQNYHRYHYDTASEIDRVADGQQRLEGKYQREINALREEFNTKIGNLTERIEVLEGVLKIRYPGDKKPNLNFDPSRTLIISHLPPGSDGDAEQFVRTFFSEVLRLTDVNIIHATRFGGKGAHQTKIKVLLADQESKQEVMAARKRAKENPTYRNIRMVASPMRLRPQKQ